MTSEMLTYLTTEALAERAHYAARPICFFGASEMPCVCEAIERDTRLPICKQGDEEGRRNG